MDVSPCPRALMIATGEGLLAVAAEIPVVAVVLAWGTAAGVGGEGNMPHKPVTAKAVVSRISPGRLIMLGVVHVIDRRSDYYFSCFDV